MPTYSEIKSAIDVFNEVGVRPEDIQQQFNAQMNRLHDEGYAKGYQAALDDVQYAADIFYETARELTMGWLMGIIQELKDRQKERE